MKCLDIVKQETVLSVCSSFFFLIGCCTNPGRIWGRRCWWDWCWGEGCGSRNVTSKCEPWKSHQGT